MQKTLEILIAFLRLGCTSFGGPIAHLGYFRTEFVDRRKWLSDQAFADLLALAQFVPGPASSQTGFAIGLAKGGLAGGIVAWIGFTLPSAILMLFAAYGLTYAQGPIAQGVIHGLKLMAVAVVAQAVWSMGRTLCPDRQRAGFALVVAAFLIAIPTAGLQLGAIGAGAVFGLLFLNDGRSVPASALGVRISKRGASLAIIAFFLVLASLPIAASFTPNGVAELANGFYRAGALVFGGGHVVLPLLQETVVKPGWVQPGDFLAGYGAAQALPGPLFTFAAFLGAKSTIGPGGTLGGIVALISIFLPGLLLMYGALPFWEKLREAPSIRRALNGVNAAVVGILGAALYHPIWTSTILIPLDASIALLLLAGITVLRLPIVLVVVLAAAIGAGSAVI